MSNDEIDNLIDRVKHLNILYVEDNLEVKKQTLKILDELFEDITTAENGLEGLEAYESQDFDIVITDLSMPKMKGMDMIKRIKDINPKQMTLITTAHSESGYIVDANRVKVDGYIIKPFDFVQLNRELLKVTNKIKEMNKI